MPRGVARRPARGGSGGDGHLDGEEVEQGAVACVEDGGEVEQDPVRGAVAAVVEERGLVRAVRADGLADAGDGGAVGGGALEEARVAAQHVARRVAGERGEAPRGVHDGVARQGGVREQEAPRELVQRLQHPVRVARRQGRREAAVPVVVGNRRAGGRRHRAAGVIGGERGARKDLRRGGAGPMAAKFSSRPTLLFYFYFFVTVLFGLALLVFCCCRGRVVLA